MESTEEPYPRVRKIPQHECANELKECIRRAISNKLEFLDAIKIIASISTAIKTRISCLERTKPDFWKESIKSLKICLAERTKEYDNIANEVNMYRLIETTCFRLSSIEKFLSSNISKYPLEYQIVYGGEGFSPVGINIYLKDAPMTHSIILAANNNFRIDEDNKTCWKSLAMVAVSKFRDGSLWFYKRKDFDLSDNPKDYCKDNFHIYDFKELESILQKFDSWYGSGLD